VDGRYTKASRDGLFLEWALMNNVGLDEKGSECIELDADQLLSMAVSFVVMSNVDHVADCMP